MDIIIVLDEFMIYLLIYLLSNEESISFVHKKAEVIGGCYSHLITLP